MLASLYKININLRGRRGRDRMVVGFTTTRTSSAYHLKLRVRIPLMAMCTRYNIMW